MIIQTTIFTTNSYTLSGIIEALQRRYHIRTPITVDSSGKGETYIKIDVHDSQEDLCWNWLNGVNQGLQAAFKGENHE